MNCGKARKWMMAFHDGELSVSRSARVRDHLSACSQCTAILEELEMVDGTVQVTEPAPEYWDSFTGRVMNRIRADQRTAEEGAREKILHQWRPLWRLAPAISIVFVAVVAVGVFFEMKRPVDLPTEMAPMTKAVGKTVRREAPAVGEEVYENSATADDAVDDRDGYLEAVKGKEDGRRDDSAAIQEPKAIEGGFDIPAAREQVAPPPSELPRRTGEVAVRPEGGEHRTARFATEKMTAGAQKDLQESPERESTGPAALKAPEAGVRSYFQPEAGRETSYPPAEMPPSGPGTEFEGFQSRFSTPSFSQVAMLEGNVLTSRDLSDGVRAYLSDRFQGRKYTVLYNEDLNRDGIVEVVAVIPADGGRAVDAISDPEDQQAFSGMVAFGEGVVVQEISGRVVEQVIVRNDRAKDGAGLAVTAADLAGWTIRPMGGPDGRGLTLNSIKVSGDVSADQAVRWDDVKGTYMLMKEPMPAIKGQ